MPYGMSLTFIIYGILILVLWWDGWIGIITGILLLGVGYMINISQQMGLGSFNFNMGSGRRKMHHKHRGHRR